MRLEVDAQGTVLRSRTYSAFGEEESVDPGSSLRPGYAGLFFDAPVALYLMR